MSTRTELYEFFCFSIPSALSEEWDNDGIMCLPSNRSIKRALICLDATPEAIAYAVQNRFDLIVTHHPLIFTPLRSIISPKLVSLVKNDIALFSFHTRLDAADGGVNDTLAALLGLQNVGKLSLGRIGDLPETLPLGTFAERIGKLLRCKKLTLVECAPSVRRVAIVGGDGKDFYAEACAAGAHAYLCGNMSYNTMLEAAEGTMSVIEAGHYNTEFPVCRTLADMIAEFDPEIETEIFDFNPIKVF